MRQFGAHFPCCILIVVLLPVVAGGALPGPDVLGLYFDAEGATTEIEVAEPAEVNLYLLLTNPTINALDAWETALTLTNGTTVAGMDLPSGALPVLAGPTDWSASFSTPLPCGVVTKLAVFRIQVSAEIDTQCFLGSVASPEVPGDFPAVKPAGESWRTVDVPSGDPSLPVAGISLPTPVNQATWGSLKLLFR